MQDPRLNSIHLQPERRDRFRAARQSLLGAAGEETLGVQAQWLAHHEREGHTAIFSSGQPLSADVQFALVDQDYVYPLKIGINTVGRMPDNDVVVSSPYVSRRHVAIVVHSQNGCELHDIASKNGTAVNGKAVRGPIKLSSGDKIQLSNHQLLFVARSDSVSQSESAPTQPI